MLTPLSACVCILAAALVHVLGLQQPVLTAARLAIATSIPCAKWIFAQAASLTDAVVEHALAATAGMLAAAAAAPAAAAGRPRYGLHHRNPRPSGLRLSCAQFAARAEPVLATFLIYLVALILAAISFAALGVAAAVLFAVGCAAWLVSIVAQAVSVPSAAARTQRERAATVAGAPASAAHPRAAFPAAAAGAGVAASACAAPVASGAYRSQAAAELAPVCPICMDEKPLLRIHGDHAVCKECLTQECRTAAADGSAARLPVRCPLCRGTDPSETGAMVRQVPDRLLQQVLTPAELQQHDMAVARAAGVRLVRCPACLHPQQDDLVGGGGAGAGPGLGLQFGGAGQLHRVRCTNPSCGAAFCLNCLRAPHPGLLCGLSQAQTPAVPAHAGALAAGAASAGAAAAAAVPEPAATAAAAARTSASVSPSGRHSGTGSTASGYFGLPNMPRMTPQAAAASLSPATVTAASAPAFAATAASAAVRALPAAAPSASARGITAAAAAATAVLASRALISPPAAAIGGAGARPAPAGSAASASTGSAVTSGSGPTAAAAHAAFLSLMDREKYAVCQCGNAVERDGGCYHMTHTTCFRPGRSTGVTHFCYTCGGELTKTDGGRLHDFGTTKEHYPRGRFEPCGRPRVRITALA